MSKSTSLGKETVLLTVSKMTTLAITMLTSMMLSRFRSFAEYGTYSQLTLVVTLFTSIFMLGLPNSINYFLARANSKLEQQKFLGVYYTLSTALSLIMGIILAFAAPLIAGYFKNPAVLTFVYFLLLYPWANVAASSVENILVVYHKTRFLMIYRIVNSLCLLGAVLVIQWLGLGFREYMAVNLGLYCLFALAVYIIAYQTSGGFRPSLDKQLIRTVFAFSLPLGLSAVVGTLNIEIDKLLIGYLMDTEQMAIYTNASKELPVSFVAASITAVLLPQLTRMLKKDRNRDAITLWANATELSYLVICLIAAGVFTYAEDVMSLLYSEKYLPGLPIFRIYTLVLLLRCTYFGIILNAKGKTKEIFWAGIASLALNAVLNPLMYWAFGMIGPALATFLSMFVVLLWQLFRTAKHTGIPFAKVFPFQRLAVITGINAILAGLFYGIKLALPLEKWTTSLGESLLLGGIWCILYWILMRKSVKRAWNGLNQGGQEDETN
ncbi:MAG: oligosaccharide flippase family protein [Oscillospiraceae bacterium]|nr:oligosaccharide flippase family protein [Oscillospiraceae bacterium]